MAPRSRPFAVNPGAGYWSRYARATPRRRTPARRDHGEAALEEVASFLARLQPRVAYLSVPTRPPAKVWVRPPREETLNRAYQILGRGVNRVEHLIGYEDNALAPTGDVEEDLLSITSVHPMREDAVDQFLARAGADWRIVRQLVEQDRLIETEYEGRRFCVRRLRARADRT